MVLGKNKGHRYEDLIFDILNEKGLLYEGATRQGMAGGVDAVLCHKGKPYNLEIKDGLSADYGQCHLSWSESSGWVWSRDDELTRFYTDLGALEHVRHKKIIPKRYVLRKEKITYEDASLDQKAFEDTSFLVKPDALWRFYSRKKTHYIQVGDGYGTYHLDEDVAGLGTPQFVTTFTLRFRAKYHDRVDRSRGGIETPWNYSFFAVLKVKKKPKRSEYNIEPSEDQDFPPIEP